MLSSASTGLPPRFGPNRQLTRRCPDGMLDLAALPQRKSGRVHCETARLRRGLCSGPPAELGRKEVHRALLRWESRGVRSTGGLTEPSGPGRDTTGGTLSPRKETAIGYGRLHASTRSL